MQFFYTLTLTIHKFWSLGILKIILNSNDLESDFRIVRNNMKLLKSSILFFVADSLGLVALPYCYGMPTNPFGTFEESQPDGTIVTLSLNGGSHDSWMVDEDQFTVVRNPETGYFVYAKPDGKGGIEPSSVVLRGHFSHEKGNDEQEERLDHQEVLHASYSSSDSVSPATASSSDFFSRDSSSFKKEKNLRPSKPDCRNKICGEHQDDVKHRKRSLRATNYALSENNSTRFGSMDSGRRAVSGEKQRLRNLVLLLRWSDHSDRRLPPREDYDILMNHNGPHFLCPTGSVRDVFLQNSYGALEVDSYVTDWIPMNNTEEYYSNGNKGMTRYIHGAIRYALDYVDNLTGHDEVNFDFFDEDEDGYIDSVTFIHSGYPAEIGGTDSYGRFYEQRIWSHKWNLRDKFQSKKGRNVEVDAYHISSGLWGLKGSEIGRIGVIAHELAHFLGLPDLYDKDSSSFGVGIYGLMANSWGADGQQLYPPYMSPWAKMMMGWVTPVEPVPGVNIVEASAKQDSSHPQLYIIKEGFPEGEFLLIENRQPIGYDWLLPQGGLAIWHIDYGSKGTYNAFELNHRQAKEGHPDQEGWPENGNHYAVALLQADGYYDLETRFNFGDFEDLFHADDVDELVPCKEMNECQYPNSDSYQDGNIARSNVHIIDISASGDVMTFNYMVEESTPTDSPTSTPTFSPTSFPTPTPTVSPTTEKERVGRKKGRICRNDRQCTSGFCKKRWRWFFGMGWSFFGRCALVD
jgi:M6 family metalloprotease-like protein